jgi:branched-chain amino acid transport system substrate-binding protein
MRRRRGMTCRTITAALMIPTAIISTVGWATVSGAASAPSGSPLVFEVAIAFTGPDAPFGPETMAGCVPAARLINGAGGVLGHPVQCKSTNTQGDPADAVPAVEKMLATGGNIVGVLGPSSDEASAVVPIIDAAKIPMFPVTGQPSFDKTTLSYFWRTLPADDVLGYAMAAWAKQRGYKNAAAVFGNSVGGQAQVPTLTKGYQKLGYTLAPNLSIALDQSSYRTEIEQVLAKKPSAMFTEMDPQTGSTFLSDLKQLSSQHIPIVGDQVILEPSWLKAVGNAIGKSALDTSCVAIQPYSPTTGPGYAAYKAALLASKSQVQNVTQYVSDPYAMDPYDATVTMALAMLQAHSTNPSVYNSHIPDVVQPAAGAVVVNTYAQGKGQLAAGHRIRYVGASGPVDFNRYHNSTGAFDAVRCDLSRQQPIGTITAAQITSLSN